MDDTKIFAPLSVAVWNLARTDGGLPLISAMQALPIEQVVHSKIPRRCSSM
jgi:hypothetical protein